MYVLILHWLKLLRKVDTICSCAECIIFCGRQRLPLGVYDETRCNGNPKISQMLEDRDMIEHPICPVSRLDCKLTDYTLFVRYKKLS